MNHNQSFKLKDPTLQIKEWIYPVIAGCRFVLVALVFTWLAFSSTAQAVTPAPDGGYPNDNTAEGDSALFSLTTGVGNTANGSQALFSVTIGDGNTASGFNALQANTSGFSNTATGIAALAGNTTGVFNTAIG